MRPACVACVLACAVAAPAAADTIYLLNGRTIHTASAQVEGDRVVFSQFGGRVSIPLSQVLRIVDDEEVESTSTVKTPAETARTRGDAPSDTPTTASSSRASYWIDQIERVDANIARIQTELDRLPEYSETDQRLFRFSGQIRYFVDERAKWERLMDTFRRQRRMLLEGARKAGIAPGALRDVRSSR